MKKLKLVALLVAFSLGLNAQQQAFEPAKLVNVFLGSSGDHGQMSPAASSPFGMMSIGPQTYPNLHAGYEYEAKKFLGFTHNRFEGVGCTGSGGLLLIKPFLSDEKDQLLKVREDASPGYYHVAFANKIDVRLTARDKSGMHQYTFPKGGKKGFFIDFSHALSNGFVAEAHEVNVLGINGWIEAKTTCGAGKYRVYYQLLINKGFVARALNAHQLNLFLKGDESNVELRVGFSAIDNEHARTNSFRLSFEALKNQSQKEWNEKLGRIRAEGDLASQKLFYSLLYRTMQSPYLISEQDGKYKLSNGVSQGKNLHYNGWAIWDNYRTQLPLLSIIQPKVYQDIATSIASMYSSGKKDYATQNEASNTVRTEHAIVVLLDAYRKGYQVDFTKITDSLVAEINRLDFSKPDKALESSYDVWALAQIFEVLKQPASYQQYLEKARAYQTYWNKDFKDIDKNDVDRMQARGLYQGTIWQYRWFVPFDVKGLKELCGGDEAYLAQLQRFYENDYYNHANEPDLQVPLMFNASKSPWLSQQWMHQLAADTVVQYYFNDNSRGIDPFIDRIYKNEPKAYIRTMDDDAGAMSAWYVFTASGFSPACVGRPVYYLNVPLFPSLTYQVAEGRQFKIRTENFAKGNKYIGSVKLNGKNLGRNWITQQEINAGGELVITASKNPNYQFGVENQFITSIEDK